MSLHEKHPVGMRELLEFVDARFDQLNLKVKHIMNELMKNLATANAEIKDRKAELISMKIALDAALAAQSALPAGAMSADQVAVAVAASAELVVAAAP